MPPGATIPGEKISAGAAAERIRAQQVEASEAAIKVPFSLPDPWSRRLFFVPALWAARLSLLAGVASSQARTVRRAAGGGAVSRAIDARLAQPPTVRSRKPSGLPNAESLDRGGGDRVQFDKERYQKRGKVGDRR